MGSLKEYANKSELMNISIKYGTEKFTFNLGTELKITEDRINFELKEQPSSYAFLSLLHKKLLRSLNDKLLEKDKEYGRLFNGRKDDTNPDTGKPYNDELCKNYALKHDDYMEVALEVNILREKVGVLETAIRAFEMRKDMIQTLSANIRGEGK